MHEKTFFYILVRSAQHEKKVNRLYQYEKRTKKGQKMLFDVNRVEIMPEIRIIKIVTGRNICFLLF